MRRLFLFVLLSALFCQPCYADIALDAVSTSGLQSGVQTVTLSHTVGSIQDGILLVAIQHSRSGVPHTNVSTVTFNGMAMTLSNNALALQEASEELWTFKGPPAGTYNIVVTFDSNYVTMRGVVSAYTFSGVDLENGPFDTATVTATGGATAPSTSITTSSDNAYILDFVCIGDNLNTQPQPTLTADGSQVARWNTVFASAANIWFIAASSTYGLKSPAGAQIMSWTQTGVLSWAHMVVALKPVSARSTIQGVSTIQGISTIQF